jgi:hypothetical protein
MRLGSGVPGLGHERFGLRMSRDWASGLQKLCRRDGETEERLVALSGRVARASSG